MRVLTWNINGLRSVVARFGTLKVLLESLAAGTLWDYCYSVSANMSCARLACSFTCIVCLNRFIVPQTGTEGMLCCMSPSLCVSTYVDVRCLQTSSASKRSRPGAVRLSGSLHW